MNTFNTIAPFNPLAGGVSFSPERLIKLNLEFELKNETAPSFLINLKKPINS